MIPSGDVIMIYSLKSASVANEIVSSIGVAVVRDKRVRSQREGVVGFIVGGLGKCGCRM